MSNEPDSDISTKQRFVGCLVGLALGDCLGAYWEGYPGTELAEAYYDGRFDPANLRMSQWTDDTAMAMATAQSIVECGAVDGADMAAKYLRWFESGGRGIGRATYHSMKRLQAGTPWDEAGHQGKYAAGNGVAMRIAPVGLWHTFDQEGLPENCRICGVITHRNEEALAAAVAVARAVAWAAAGELDFDTLAVRLVSQLPPTRTADSIIKAGQLIESKVPPLQALPQLGLGGSSFETVATVLYCLMHWPNEPVKGLVSAIVNGGDTDTRAAIVGAIYGAHFGEQVWPQRWTSQLPGAEGIYQLAIQLYEVTTR